MDVVFMISFEISFFFVFRNIRLLQKLSFYKNLQCVTAYSEHIRLTYNICHLFHQYCLHK